MTQVSTVIITILDKASTGLIVPITGKTDLDGIERQGMSVARLFCSVVKRVYRVFVDHPVFSREQVSTPDGRRHVIYPYSPTVRFPSSCLCLFIY